MIKYPDFYTKEMIKESEFNRKMIRYHYIYIGLIPKDERAKYELHHKDESLRYDNPERYIQWLEEDLEIMTHEEHCKLHNWNSGHTPWNKGLKNCYSEETLEKLRKNCNKNISDEAKQKLSDLYKGRKWEVVDGRRHWCDR